RSMLVREEPYDYLHSFWSDQYEHVIEYVGFAASWDHLVFRGRPESRKFLGFYLKEGIVRAAVGLDRGGDPEDPKGESELKLVAGLIRDRVPVPFFNPCNRCYWCVRGEHHACPSRQRRSVQFNLDQYPYCDGGYAEYYFLPPGHYVFKVPDVLPDEAIPPVNCALCQVLHGLEYAEMKFGDVVVIQGAGGLGIYAAAVAAEKGASKVISIDGQKHRLAF